MKSEITEHWFAIEPKGIDVYEVRNRALRIFVSNDAAPVAIDLNDRRFFVLEVSNIHAEDSVYFKTLQEKTFRGDEMAAFVYDALHADLTEFEKTRRNPPKTRAKAALAAITARPEHEFLLELLEQGSPPGGGGFGWGPQPFPRTNAEPADPWRAGPVTVERDALHRAYIDWLKNSNAWGRRGVNAPELDRMIQQVLGPTLFHSHPVRDGVVKRRMTLIGGLDECRAAYDRHTGFSREWL